jgi:hypothetical protein
MYTKEPKFKIVLFYAYTPNSKAYMISISSKEAKHKPLCNLTTKETQDQQLGIAQWGCGLAQWGCGLAQ